MVEISIKEKEKERNKDFEDNLFLEQYLQRHTYLTSDEIPIFNVLLELGKQIDNHRLKYLSHKSDKPCVLTRISDTALRLRTSREGWRSKQTVDISQNKSMRDNPDYSNGLGQKLISMIKK